MTWKLTDKSSDKYTWEPQEGDRRQRLLVTGDGALIEIYDAVCLRYHNASVGDDGKIDNHSGTASVRQDPSLAALSDAKLWEHMTAVAAETAEYWRAADVEHHGGYRPPAPKAKPPQTTPVSPAKKLTQKGGLIDGPRR